MNNMQGVFYDFRLSGGIAAVFAGVVLLAFSVTASAQFEDYVGSDECVACHEANWNEWQVSGHPYKLMRAEEARNRPIPLPEGLTWDDVSWVIGGYKWKSRYLDENGYVYTPAEGRNQYNMLTGEWSDYHAGETKPYDCGQCHTTGWIADPDTSTPEGKKDGLEGIHGDFYAGGIHCEECHGPGVDFSFTTGMVVDNSADACGECHHRTAAPGAAENVIPASGGFVRHHEQYNEHLAGPHAAFDCVDCHNPHKKSDFSIWKDGERREWSGLEPEKIGAGAQCGVDCHSNVMTSFSQTSMYDYGVTCQDCHMPFATKSAQALGPYEGDVMTHIFYINTDPNANMFTDDGLFVDLDDNGKAAVTMDFACQRCHETATLEELAKFAQDFHGQNKTLENIGVDPGLTGTWWNAARSGEGFVLQFGYAPGTTTLTLFASFYTYDDLGNQVWLVALPSSIDGTTVNVDVYITSGRRWGENFNPNDGSTDLWGTGVFTFPTCTSGTVSLMPNDVAQAAGFTNLMYDLTRDDFLGTATACPTFVNNAQ